MREILFRIKDCYGDWCECGAICIGGKAALFSADGSVLVTDKHDLNTLSQWTGLTDKNGVKIFEGDIVKGKMHTVLGYRVKNGQIIFECGGFRIKVTDEEMSKNIFGIFEVIGNKWDNPELLEVNK